MVVVEVEVEEEVVFVVLVVVVEAQMHLHPHVSAPLQLSVLEARLARGHRDVMTLTSQQKGRNYTQLLMEM